MYVVTMVTITGCTVLVSYTFRAKKASLRWYHVTRLTRVARETVTRTTVAKGLLGRGLVHR